jgi:predicted nucleic-acid-binding protein
VRSLDTNVVLRALTLDDSVQAAQSVALLSAPAYITPTVLLETAWALSTVFKRSRNQVAENLRDLLALPDVVVGQREHVVGAIDRFAQGADFADMMHLALSGGSECFTTFDRGIARFADESVVLVETLRP